MWARASSRDETTLQFIFKSRYSVSQLRAVAARLSTLPDVVFVDVKNEQGTVRVEKLGSDLLIRVVSPLERVEIAVPIDSVRKLMHKLEA